MVCDAEGAIVLWNPAAERMFGYTEAEALGQSMDMIIPERLRKRHWEGYDKTMATGITKYGHDVLRVPAVDKARAARCRSPSPSRCSIGAGRQGQRRSLSIIRDETARFNDERALKKRVAELEAQLAAKA